MLIHILIALNVRLSLFADALESLLLILIRIEHVLTKLLPVLIGIIAMLSFSVGYLLSKL